MDFPTIKKPKSKLDVSANSNYKPGIFETMSKMEADAPKADVMAESKVPTVKDVNTSIDKVPSAMTVSPAASKAELLKVRAMIANGKAKTKKIESQMAENIDEEQYDSYEKDKGYYKKKK